MLNYTRLYIYIYNVLAMWYVCERAVCVCCV